MQQIGFGGQEPSGGDMPKEAPFRPSDPALRPLAAAAAILRLALVVAFGIGIVTVLARRSPVPAPNAAPADLAYVENAALPPLMGLATAEPLRDLRDVARSRNTGRERRDALTLGEWGADALFLRLAAAQGESTPQPKSLFVDLATNSAGVGAAVLRVDAPQTLVTARGPVEWADATLSGLGGERECIGFRFPPQGGDRLSGLACGPRDSRIEQAKLECLIDALTITPEGAALGFAGLVPGIASRRANCARSLA